MELIRTVNIQLTYIDDAKNFNTSPLEAKEVYKSMLEANTEHIDVEVKDFTYDEYKMEIVIKKLIEERNELSGKIGRLAKYLLNSTYGTDTDHKNKTLTLMNAQLSAMQNYLFFLDERIELFSHGWKEYEL